MYLQYIGSRAIASQARRIARSQSGVRALTYSKENKRSLPASSASVVASVALMSPKFHRRLAERVDASYMVNQAENKSSANANCMSPPEKAARYRQRPVRTIGLVPSGSSALH